MLTTVLCKTLENIAQDCNYNLEIKTKYDIQSDFFRPRTDITHSSRISQS